MVLRVERMRAERKRVLLARAAATFVLVGATASVMVRTGEQALPRAPHDVRVRLESENDSGEAGSATLSAVGNRTRVTISVTGEPAGAAQPANIHTGRCGSVEIIKYELQSVRNGRSTSLVAVPLERLVESHLVINVQASVMDLHAPKDARDVSCGPIPPATRIPHADRVGRGHPPARVH
jgi:hypothetical protein